MSILIDQALVQSFIDGDFGLPVAHENDGYNPTAGTAFAALSIVKNDERALTLNDLDDVTGFLQINLRYPSGAGAIPAKTMEQSIFDLYPIGRTITRTNQDLEITGRTRVSARVDDGWYLLVLRINFVAILPR